MNSLAMDFPLYAEYFLFVFVLLVLRLGLRGGDH